MVRYTILWLVIFVLLPLRFDLQQARGKSMDTNLSKNKSTTRSPNRLAKASSPYLQAHADNPVDWYEWGKEAFNRAIAEDKPIFLSIGYNACHWCHVMEHESFEDEETAALLNEHFISIKVDREERPDIDQIYMAAVTALTGNGGWPMSVFMTPDKKPFFAGTYFPPESGYGRPGFKYLITELAKGYREKRSDILRSAQTVVDHISSNPQAQIPPRPIDRTVIISGADEYLSQLDNRHGGFGGAPKFPQAAGISLLFRAQQITGEKKYGDAAFLTLRKMAEGGIYDQLGGGFHRYSVDEKWLVPHFEKMLYDNALLAVPYLEAYQISGDSFYLNIVSGILGHIQADMTDAEGGIHSTLDADSEGEEGKFYVWDEKELEEVLGSDAEWFGRYYGLIAGGNFEHGKTILNINNHSTEGRNLVDLDDDAFETRLKELKSDLLAHRSNRIHPSKDDKILASWNGLAISAFARAWQVIGDDEYLKSARNAADFVLTRMTEGDRLYHSYRDGRLLKVELLEDYAYFIAGLIDLYQASLDEKYLHKAQILTETALETFSENNLFYSSPADETDLIIRPLDFTDGSTPSPAAVMIANLFHLGFITGDTSHTEKADAALWAVSGLASRAPRATASLLLAGHLALEEALEVVIVGDDPVKMREFNRALFARFIPNKIVVGNIDGNKSDLPLLAGRQDVDRLTYYFCRNKTCRLPVTDRQTLNTELDRLVSTARKDSDKDAAITP